MKKFLWPALLALPLISCGSSTPTSVFLVFCAPNEAIQATLKRAEKEFETQKGIDLDIRYVIPGDLGNKEEKYDLYFSSAPQIDQDEATVLPEKYRSIVEGREESNLLPCFEKDGSLRCFPMAIKIGTALYYDSSTYTDGDVLTWEGILSKGDAAIYCFSGVEYFGAFYGNGLDTTFVSTGTVDNLNSAKGLEVAKALSVLLSNERLSNNPLSLDDGCKAVLSFSAALRGMLGNRFDALTMPPSFGGFSWANSYNTLGLVLAKQDDAKKTDVLLDFASLVSNKDYQKEIVSAYASEFVPTNKEGDISTFPVEEVLKGKEYSNYPMEWYAEVEKLIAIIKNDNGQRSEEVLSRALQDYHDKVLNIGTK